MEQLGDDELLYIFNKIPFYYMEDKRSFAQVSKQFMKVACVGLYRLYNCFPDLLSDILPSSPNLRQFQCYKQLSTTQLKLLAESCPKLQNLMLGMNLTRYSIPGDFGFDFDFNFDSDFEDDGLRAVGNSCSYLRYVNLSRRLRFGDVGVVSLVTSCKNLMKLSLEGCIRVTDESLKAIGESRIRNLNLGRCYLITDLGLKCFAIGELKNCLQYLNLSECDRISDNGVIHLNQMVGLTELNLSKCGVHVTDHSIAMLFQLSNIEILDLSWLIKVTDNSLLAIGSKCLKLKEVYLTGCEAITAEGLRAFSGHPTLKRLDLFSCYNFSWEDVESVALTCVKIEYLGLMKKIKTPMPESEFSYFRCCRIDWDEDSKELFY